MKPSPQPDFETHGNEFLDNSHLGFLLLGEEAEIKSGEGAKPCEGCQEHNPQRLHPGGLLGQHISGTAPSWQRLPTVVVAPAVSGRPAEVGGCSHSPPTALQFQTSLLEAFPLPNSCQERPGTGYIIQVFD